MRKKRQEQVACGIEPTVELDSIRIIKGLLNALNIAHKDNNAVLFSRIKSVLSLMARGTSSHGQVSSHELKDCKLLLTEVMGLVLRPTKDRSMHQAYMDCFFTISKQFSDSEDKQLVKFVAFTYKQLIMKYLGGRGTSNKSLNPQFFSKVFEHCNL